MLIIQKTHSFSLFVVDTGSVFLDIGWRSRRNKCEENSDRPIYHIRI